MMICQEESENFIFVNGKEYFVNPETGELQNVLRDYSSTGKERPWRKYKIENQTVEQCYRLLEKREWNQNNWKEKRIVCMNVVCIYGLTFILEKMAVKR